MDCHFPSLTIELWQDLFSCLEWFVKIFYGKITVMTIRADDNSFCDIRPMAALNSSLTSAIRVKIKRDGMARDIEVIKGLNSAEMQFGVWLAKSGENAFLDHVVSLSYSTLLHI